MSLSVMAYIFLVQYLAFIIKGLVGFGNPLISSPLMAMRLDNKVITPANLLLDWPVNMWMVWSNRKSFSIRKTMPVALLIMCGVIPGTFFLKLGSPWIIKAILGVYIIGLGLEMITRSSSKGIKPNKIVMALVSFTSGIMAGLFGINMLVLAYFERTAADRGEFRSNVGFVFLVENTFRFIIYYANGMFLETSLLIAAMSIPAAILGVWTGVWIDRRVNDRTAERLVITVFILGGISILLKAVIFRA